MASEKAPVPLRSTPAKLVDVLSPPVVSVAAAPLSVTTAPETPLSEPMLLELPARSSVAPLAERLTAEFVPKAVVEPAVRVPAETVVPPV